MVLITWIGNPNGKGVVLKFPSPCGDYGSYPVKIAAFTTSVESFRPLAGIMVLIEMERKFKGIWIPAKFPSPCGDYGSYHRTQRRTGAHNGFRPLEGIMVLIGSLKVNGMKMTTLVSVPLRGLWFLSAN